MIQAEIMELLLELRESSGVALILITHDLRIVSQVTQPAIEDGRLGRRRETDKAINGVTLEVRRDEAFCLVGESGCGKSRVARSIVGLLRPTSGAIYHDGDRLDGVAPSQLKTYRRITVS